MHIRMDVVRQERKKMAIEQFNLFDMMGMTTQPEKKAEKKEKDAKPKTTTSESVYVFPLKVVLGYVDSVVLERKQFEADKVDETAIKKVLSAMYPGLPEKFLKLEGTGNCVYAFLDDSRAMAKGSLTFTNEHPKAAFMGELFDLPGKKELTVKEASEALKDAFGGLAEFRFIVDGDLCYPLLGSANVTEVAKPVKMVAFRNNELLEVLNLPAPTAEAEEDEEANEESGEDVKAEKEKPKMVGERELLTALYLKYPELKGNGEIRTAGDNTVVFVFTKKVKTPSAPAKKEETFKTTATISLIFRRIKLSPDMFGGKEEVGRKEILAVLNKEYPEYTSERTTLTYDTKINTIFPGIKGSSKGATLYASRDDAKLAAEKEEYFLGEFAENDDTYRVEKTPISMTIAGGSDGEYRYYLPKCPSQLVDALFEFFSFVAWEHDVEALAWIMYDTSKNEYSIKIPAQTVGRAYVTTDEVCEETLTCFRIADIHSHGYISAFFSQLDNFDEKGNRVYGVVGGIGSEDEKILFRAGTGGQYVSIAPDDWCGEETSASWQKVSRADLYREWRKLRY